ncbi:uncharacterized protein LOC133313464 [Gastrolobium bilobum]|uniref:uncharacterized protein LOC133313464 n=1 Tax=Gastrolobium bilobum TaxID=150636 RepID=UPI002AB0B10C|nr:uncharacterized protein LOC133313464 [Gastrolobium bilobum]
MPTFVKFMKEILSRKRRLEEFETVALTQDSIKYMLSKLPPKLEDPGSFAIPCTIGDHYQGRALCDLGASIHLMPRSVFKKLRVREASPTTVTLQLTNYEEDREVPIILGRAFLVTRRAIIDVKEGELSMNVNGEQCISGAEYGGLGARKDRAIFGDEVHVEADRMARDTTARKEGEI